MNRARLISNLILLGFKGDPEYLNIFTYNNLEVYIYIKNTTIYKNDEQVEVNKHSFKKTLTIINKLLTNE